MIIATTVAIAFCTSFFATLLALYIANGLFMKTKSPEETMQEYFQAEEEKLNHMYKRDVF